MIIKICGITNLDDARLALELGADWLGFNFYPRSPRYLAPERAREIIEELPRASMAVGVFVNAGMEGVGAVLEQCPLALVQLHGDETPEEFRKVKTLGARIMKAVRVGGPADIGKIHDYPGEYVLLDAFRPEVYGGTGETFDWSWIAHTGGKKLLLAGGITPDNVAEACAAGTYGLDICSGVETRPGVKNLAKMRQLFENLKHS